MSVVREMREDLELVSTPRRGPDPRLTERRPLYRRPPTWAEQHETLLLFLFGVAWLSLCLALEWLFSRHL
jgi:hypothetical protein